MYLVLKCHCLYQQTKSFYQFKKKLFINLTTDTEIEESRDKKFVK